MPVGVWALPASGNEGEFVMSAQISWCMCGRMDWRQINVPGAVLHLVAASVPSWPHRGRQGPRGGVLCPVPRPELTQHLPTGTRESAFVYALSAAAISHAIARACTSGDLPGCSCGPVPGEPPGPGNRWGGCADNLSYGLLMGAKFSDAPMKVKKTGSQANKLMRLHNSEVGRQVTTHPTHPRWLCLCQTRKGPPSVP